VTAVREQARVPSSPGVPALEVSGLTHRYRDRIALEEVTFSVAPGEIFALLGPNGGGKTTLFRIVVTLLRPTSGAVRVMGHEVTSDPAGVRRALGVVFQSAALDRQLTVRENLWHHGACHGLRGATLDRAIDAILETLSLAERRHDFVQTLSGGLQRRVELAKALLPEPPVLVLDEPSTGLDPRARRELWDALVALRARTGATIVLTTHLMDEAARCDRVAILNRGHLVALGMPHELTSTVGGDVLWFSAPDPDRLAAEIRARFALPADVVDGRVRLERARGHEFLTEVIEALPGQVDAVTLSRPTLEDVFVHHTGERFT
jgi:ABC-2 type transport system ATP-binding protein